MSIEMNISEQERRSKEKQLARESYDYELATQMERFRVQQKRTSGQEYDFTYGKKLITMILPVVKGYLDNLSVGKNGNSNKTWNAIIKPKVKEYENDKKSFKKNPIQMVSDMVALVLVSNISKNINLTQLSHTMSRHLFNMFKVPFETIDADGEKVRFNTLKFFQVIIDTVAHDTNIISVDRIYNDSYMVSPTEQTKKYIDFEFEKAMSVNKASYRAMVCEPTPIASLVSEECGYLTLPSPIFKHPHRNKGQVDKLISECTDETNPMLFDTLNVIQNTPFCINKKFLSILLEYKEKGMFFKGSAYEEDQCIGEYTEAVKKTIKERNKNRRRFATWKGIEYVPLSSVTVEKEMDKAIYQAKEEVSKTNNLIEQALEDVNEPALYFPFMLDHRGRRYPYSVYGVSYQGTSLSKCLVQFADKKQLTQEGVYELFSTLGNCLGHDKKRGDVKVLLAMEWFQTRLESFNDGLFDEFFTEQEKFDEPDNALAVTLELIEWRKDPNYECGYVAHRDARCSGASIIGTMLNDKAVMTMTSVYEEDVPEALPDAYMHGAITALKLCKKSDNPLAKDLLKLKEHLFSRTAFKYPVMTRCSYGLTDYALKEQNKEFLIELGIYSEDNESQLTRDHLFLYNNIMLQALKEALPSCSIFLDKMRQVARDVINNGGTVKYVDPLTGMPVVYQEFQEKKTHLEIPSAFRTINTVIYKKTDKTDKMATINGFSPNLVHHVDATILLEVQKLVECDIATIHDSIGSHPNDVRQVRSAYNKVMALLNKTDYLNNILRQMTDIRIDKIEDKTVSLNNILNSKHSLA